MKNVIRITLMLLLVPMVASAQWEFASVFPDSVAYTNAHGLTVDNDDNVWIAPYYSLIDTVSNTRYNPVFVYNSDGTEADFSPLIGTTVADTLLRFGPITGVNKGADGNIYVASHGFRMTADTEGAVIGGTWRSNTAFIHVIDAETGEGIEVVEIQYMRTETAAHAPNRPAVTEDGFVALSFVFPASPIVILDPSDNWSELNRVTDSKLGFSRTLEVNNDGTMLFNPQTDAYEEGDPAGHINVWESESVFDEYTVGLPIAKGANPGSIARYPGSDILYFSGAGVGNDANAVEPWISSRYYAFSLESMSLLEGEHFDWNYGDDVVFRTPRSMAFSSDGLTAYVGSFNQGSGNVQKFTRGEAVSVEHGSDIAEGFELEQNYPNPFNPTTTISYTIADAGMTTIRVYDMLGRVVSTLVNDNMPAGTHSVNFDAANLGSGVYLYELTNGNVRLTNKMTLVK
jgi:hypothetical protein